MSKYFYIISALKQKQKCRCQCFIVRFSLNKIVIDKVFHVSCITAEANLKDDGQKNTTQQLQFVSFWHTQVDYQLVACGPNMAR